MISLNLVIIKIKLTCILPFVACWNLRFCSSKCVVYLLFYLSIQLLALFVFNRITVQVISAVILHLWIFTENVNSVYFMTLSSIVSIHSPQISQRTLIKLFSCHFPVCALAQHKQRRDISQGHELNSLPCCFQHETKWKKTPPGLHCVILSLL